MTAGTEGALVSVVMIFREAERFFEEAIRSVLAQSHTNLELLLCDDGSTDGSTSIAQSWAAKLPNTVRYLEHPSHAWRGMSASRNLGIFAAKGDVVAFLDADDVWDPTHLEEHLRLLAEHPHADLVCGRALDWYSWGDASARDEWSPLPARPGTVVPPPRMLSAILRNGSFATPICSLTVRREVLVAVGGCEEDFRGLWEDQVLLAKLHVVASSVIGDSRTAKYRRHPGSSTERAKRRGDYIKAHQIFLAWLTSHIATSPARGDADLNAALAQARALYAGRAARIRWALRSAVLRLLPWPMQSIARALMSHAAAATRRKSLLPVRMGSLRRLTPISRQFGFNRGLPIDRHYIERFLSEHEDDIAGRVLEVGDPTYTRQFGGARVDRVDVLNVTEGYPETTIVADLANGAGIPAETFDCIVLTQTLHLVYDLQAAVRTVHRILRPGGVVLATFPGLSPLSIDEWAGTWHWGLTPASAKRLFGDVFLADHVEVVAFGNVLTTVAFMEGMATEELRPDELCAHDPQFPMLITVRARRPAADSGHRAEK